MSNCSENNPCLNCSMKSGSCLIGHEIKQAESLDEANVKLLNFIADIRAAAGDPEGKLGWIEFVNHVKGKMDRLELLESAVKAFVGKDCEIDERCFTSTAPDMNLVDNWIDAKAQLHVLMVDKK